MWYFGLPILKKIQNAGFFGQNGGGNAASEVQPKDQENLFELYREISRVSGAGFWGVFRGEDAGVFVEKGGGGVFGGDFEFVYECYKVFL